MCGRYTRQFTWREIHDALDLFGRVVTPTVPLEPAYNIAPTQLQPVLVPQGEALQVEEMRWGLVPPWAKDEKIAYSTINARLETVATKPAFRSAWKARRCIVPASGYYEWPVIDGVKRPHYIHRTDAPVLLFAGLWEQRGDLLTYSIVTKDADPAIAGLHDRMPLILEPAAAFAWGSVGPEEAMSIALAAPEPPMAFHEVGKAVGNVRNQGPQLIERFAA